MFDYAERRRHLGERMESEGIDILFLAPSADLEYLTGVERDIPNFCDSSYAHGWVAGAFFRPGAEPVFVFPRMFVAFHLQQNLPDGELVVVNETDDGPAIFDRIARGLGATGTGSTVGRSCARTSGERGRLQRRLGADPRALHQQGRGEHAPDHRGPG